MSVGSGRPVLSVAPAIGEIGGDGVLDGVLGWAVDEAGEVGGTAVEGVTVDCAGAGTVTGASPKLDEARTESPAAIAALMSIRRIVDKLDPGYVGNVISETKNSRTFPPGL